MSSYAGGPHELGQNFLVDPAVADAIQHLVAATDGPIVELAAGDGALTTRLSRSQRPITAVELDPKRAGRLRRRTPEHVAVVNGDILRFRLPEQPHVLVGNLPFHITTAVLKRLLPETRWHTAVLVVQWEVARRRAGVGGATMLTASWWPWYEFTLHRRIPARSFRPVPAVDGGLLAVHRRPRPLVTDRAAYQAFVREVFTGRGRGLREVLERTGRVHRGALDAWLRAERVSPRALPKDLTAEQWAALWGQTREPAPGSRAAARRRGPRSGRW
ncbi:23S ribosomal RNA methyltransferase Erm [Salinifilum ghardaiensis]